MDEETEQPATTAPRRDIIAEAEAAALKLAGLNKDLAEKLDRLEHLQVEHTLSGRAVVHSAPREETDEEYTDKVMRGDLVGERE
jgi:hypothetical protein